MNPVSASLYIPLSILVLILGSDCTRIHPTPKQQTAQMKPKPQKKSFVIEGAITVKMKKGSGEIRLIDQQTKKCNTTISQQY